MQRARPHRTPASAVLQDLFRRHPEDVTAALLHYADRDYEDHPPGTRAANAFLTGPRAARAFLTAAEKLAKAAGQPGLHADALTELATLFRETHPERAGRLLCQAFREALALKPDAGFYGPVGLSMEAATWFCATQPALAVSMLREALAWAKSHRQKGTLGHGPDADLYGECLHSLANLLEVASKVDEAEAARRELAELDAAEGKTPAATTGKTVATAAAPASPCTV